MTTIIFRGVSEAQYDKGEWGTPKGIITKERPFMGGHNPDGRRMTHSYYGSGQKLDSSMTNSIFLHQIDSSKFKRGYVSFSTKFGVAKNYALATDDQGNPRNEVGHVLEVDIAKLPPNVGFVSVASILANPKKPEDCEVLIYPIDGTPIPLSIFVRHHWVYANDLSARAPVPG
ncbi:hypothetical protein ACG3SL_02115 [Sphingomonas sp. CJ20]